MRKKYDKGAIGFVFGLILPLITMVILYFALYGHLEFSEFLRRLIISQLFFSVLSICVLPNLLLFFIFIWTMRNFAARGVLGATFFYAFIVMGFRIFD